MPEHINTEKLERLLELAKKLNAKQLDQVLLYTNAFIDGANFGLAHGTERK